MSLSTPGIGGNSVVGGVGAVKSLLWERKVIGVCKIGLRVTLEEEKKREFAIE